MALDRIHLRKLLKILFLPQNKRLSELRRDIREDRRRLADSEGSGGDFYTPFWADAKAHVFGTRDLRASVDARIEANGRRGNLYPQLRDGFLHWWNDERRWTNEPFERGQHLRSHFPFPELTAVVKIDSILSVRDALGQEHAIYSYVAPEPLLTEEAARLGLWLLTRAFPNVPPHEFRILDVFRGRTFSLDRTPLVGDEESDFRARYARVLREWEALR